MSSEQVLYALMYEVKWMSKNPPSTTAIVSNRKDRPCRTHLYQVRVGSGCTESACCTACTKCTECTGCTDCTERTECTG